VARSNTKIFCATELRGSDTESLREGRVKGRRARGLRNRSWSRRDVKIAEG